jgi:hypothetical protein
MPVFYALRGELTTGRTEQRHRLLPAQLMVYYVLALALFAGVGMVEVLPGRGAARGRHLAPPDRAVGGAGTCRPNLR